MDDWTRWSEGPVSWSEGYNSLWLIIEMRYMFMAVEKYWILIPNHSYWLLYNCVEMFSLKYPLRQYIWKCHREFYFVSFSKSYISQLVDLATKENGCFWLILFHIVIFCMSFKYLIIPCTWNNSSFAKLYNAVIRSNCHQLIIFAFAFIPNFALPGHAAFRFF